MDEHHSWYNGSVWHIHWPYQVYQWPIFYGPAILLHILKTIWWRNVSLRIMDHCDSKIDIVKYMWVSDLYFMVHWFYLMSLSALNYFYTLYTPPGTCSSKRSTQWTTKALISLHGCAGWAALLLFAYGINRFSHNVAHFMMQKQYEGWVPVAH